MRRRINRKQRNAGLADTLEPGIDHAQGAQGLDHRIGFLGDHGLQLGHQVFIVAPSIQGDRCAAQAPDFGNLGVEGFDIKVVTGAGHADGNAFAGQGRHIVVVGMGQCAQPDADHRQRHGLPEACREKVRFARGGCRHDSVPEGYFQELCTDHAAAL